MSGLRRLPPVNSFSGRANIPQPLTRPKLLLPSDSMLAALAIKIGIDLLQGDAGTKPRQAEQILVVAVLRDRDSGRRQCEGDP